jgi:hypothetical protein
VKIYCIWLVDLVEKMDKWNCAVGSIFVVCLLRGFVNSFYTRPVKLLTVPCSHWQTSVPSHWFPGVLTFYFQRTKSVLKVWMRHTLPPKFMCNGISVAYACMWPFDIMEGKHFKNVYWETDSSIVLVVGNLMILMLIAHTW